MPVTDEGVEVIISPLGDSAEPNVKPDNPGTGSTEDTWKTVRIGVPAPNPLNNFIVKISYYRTTSDAPAPTPDNPNPDPVTATSYPGFKLNSISLNAISPSGGDVFAVGESYPTEPTFEASTGNYDVGEYATSGISDGAAYLYAKVFDQTEFRLLPRGYEPPPNPPIVDESEEVDSIPLEPFDPDADIFPYTSITAYKPDTRTNVQVTYSFSYTLQGKIGATYGPAFTEAINITQWVQQSIYDWGPACRYYACRGKYAYTGNENYCPVGPINTNEYPF